MKKITTIIVLCTALNFAPEIGHAQDNGFGIGAMINSPTGISYKAWINGDAAVAGAVTFNISEGVSSFYTHADFLMHSTGDGTVELDSGVMRFYYGGGLRLRFNDLTDDTRLGIRAPLGTTYQFEEFSGDIFFEFVPTILFDNFNFGFNGALGFRYYLN